MDTRTLRQLQPLQLQDITEAGRTVASWELMGQCNRLRNMRHGPNRLMYGSRDYSIGNVFAKYRRNNFDTSICNRSKVVDDNNNNVYSNICRDTARPHTPAPRQPGTDNKHKAPTDITINQLKRYSCYLATGRERKRGQDKAP